MRKNARCDICDLIEKLLSHKTTGKKKEKKKVTRKKKKEKKKTPDTFIGIVQFRIRLFKDKLGIPGVFIPAPGWCF
jgi:hypothetical protein